MVQSVALEPQLTGSSLGTKALVCQIVDAPSKNVHRLDSATFGARQEQE
jgi:hypothetical protein